MKQKERDGECIRRGEKVGSKDIPERKEIQKGG